MTSITVFTYGDPDVSVRDDLESRIVRHTEQLPRTVVLGVSSGHGQWFGDTEHCGSVVVSGIGSESSAAYIGASAAALYGQQAVGVVFNADGRTLATPGTTDLSTADEIWG